MGYRYGNKRPRLRVFSGVLTAFLREGGIKYHPLYFYAPQGKF